MQRERDLDAGTLAQLVDRVRERLPVSVGLRAVQDQDRVTHVVFDEVKDGFGHHHVRGGHPVIHGDDGPMRAVVHERVGIERGDSLVMQGPQQLADRHAPRRSGVNRSIEMNEENLRLRAGGGTIGIQVSGVHTHVSSSYSFFCLMSNVPVLHPPRHAGINFELGAKSRTRAGQWKRRRQK